MSTDDAQPRERGPRERKTLEDALIIATRIVDLSDENRHAVDVDHYTLAAGFIVLANDLNAMLDAALKRTQVCGWCEMANGGRLDGIKGMTLDEVRTHTVECEYNPVVAERNQLRACLRDAILAVRTGRKPEAMLAEWQSLAGSDHVEEF